MTNAAVQPRPPLTPADYDPFDPQVRADPYPYFAVLRRDAPVHPIRPGLPFYVVTRHEHVSAVVHDPETYSSTAFQLLFQGGGLTMAPNSGALAGHRLLASPMMIASDPPDHGGLRRIVNRGFTPRRIAALEPRLREVAARTLAPHLPAGELELMRDFAIPFPVTVIAELLGVEVTRYEEFKRWSDTFVFGLSGSASSYTREDVLRAADEMAEYFERIAAERRSEPREDLISALVRAEEGEALTSSQILSFVTLLLIAGNETTTNLIGNTARVLLRFPEALARVCRDRARIPDLVEEALRWDSPVQAVPRRLLRDAQLGGVALPKDAFVMVMFGSANRDERVFPDPDRFDLDRRGRDHVAFGHGIHFCLGASLARLEARVAFETLLAGCGERWIGAADVPVVDSLVVRGPQRLPFRFEPAGASRAS
jgi:cytochrome P450